MAIKDYSTTASSNTALFPEGMNPSDVNNGMRQVQADIRSFYETPQWRDLGDTVSYVSASSFKITGDVTADYIVNQRVKLYGTTMGTLYATIATSGYSAPDTTITLTMDSGSLTSNLSAVSIGVDPTNSPIAVEAIKNSPTLTGNNTFSGNVAFTGKVSFPDDGELTIASGAITVTGSNHTIDTEADAASDDLITINGGVDGMELTLRIENDARAVVIKDGDGNIETPDGEDITLTDDENAITLLYDSALSKWLVKSVFAADPSAASSTAAGIIEIADSTEYGTGTDSTKALVASLFAKYNSGSDFSITLPGGQIVKMGRYTGGAHSPTITFQTAFPSSCEGIIAMAVASEAQGSIVCSEVTGTKSASSVQIKQESGPNNTNTTNDLSWLAWGR